MINVNQITSELARMPDAALKQYATMHKNDPYTMSLAMSESNRRKQMREGTAPQGGQQPTVVDQELSQMSAPQLQMPQGQPQGMPEDMGIGVLPQQPMGKAMAGGGIVAFAKAGAVKDPLAQYETQIRSEAIRQGVDPDMAMRLFRQESAGQADAVSPKGATGLGQLMVPAAKEMGLKPEERSDPSKNIPASIGYFKKQLMAFKDPETALAAYNWGPGNVREHLAKNEGQLNKVGLPKETADYLNKILPVGTAYAAPEKTGIANTEEAKRVAAIAQIPGQSPVPVADDAASRIPGQTVQAPAAVAAPNSFLGRQADKLGISEDTQRNISNLATGLGGAMGAGFIPRYFPKVSGGIAALGEKAHAILNPSKQMTAAEIESLRIANQGSRVAEAAQSAEMAGALPAEARTAAQAVEEANALKLAQAPSEAQKVQAAADMRQAQEANRLATVGKATQNVGQAAASSAAIDTALGQPAAATAGGIPDLNRAQEDFRRAEIEQQNAAAQPSLAPDAAVTAATTSAEKPSWLTNDRALNMGLQMMAGSGKPGSGSALRDLMQSAGAAGIGTLAQEREERKLKSTELENLARTETLKGQGRKFGAEADILASGLKGSVQAATLAQTRMKDFTSTMQGKLADEATRTRIYNQFLMDAYNSLGIPPPTAAPAATPAARTGWGTATTG